VKRQTVERFNVLLPFEADDKFAANLSAKGVEVAAREPANRSARAHSSSCHTC